MLIPRPDDLHVHVRQGPALSHYVRDCAATFGRALIMPNTLPPIVDVAGLNAYEAEIMAAAKPYPWFQPLMTFKIMANMSPRTVADLAAAGAVAGKLYPQGATTNSEDGVAEIEGLFPLFAAMEAADLVLCLHGEAPKAFSLDRETAFLPQVQLILKSFPRLRVILEHVSTARGIAFVCEGPENLGATVTVHHLLKNLDDMVGGHLNPHLFCKPILKRPEDQHELRKVVLAAHKNSRIFFGSDSAPHSKAAKECDCGAAGVYTMPVAIPLLAELFSREASLADLVAFTSTNGGAFYRLPAPGDTLEILEETWKVPAEYHGVVPFSAGRELGWKVVQ